MDDLRAWSDVVDPGIKLPVRSTSVRPLPMDGMVTPNWPATYVSACAIDNDRAAGALMARKVAPMSAVIVCMVYIVLSSLMVWIACPILSVGRPGTKKFVKFRLWFEPSVCLEKKVERAQKVRFQVGHCFRLSSETVGAVQSVDGRFVDRRNMAFL